MDTNYETPEVLQGQQTSNALESIERAQIDMQISTAKKYPRTLSKVKQDMLSFATLDEETAASCFYTLPRGGKAIQGPSVRLAEIALSSYGNLKAGTRILSTVAEGQNPHVIVQSVAIDMERNVSVSIEKRRRIVGKKSRGGAIDEDDINLATNACSAIALRDAVFKVVPLALIKPVFEAAKKVAVGQATSLVAKRTKVIDRLKQMGVTEDRILSVVDCRKLDDVGMEQLEILIGLGTAIKDGEVTIEDAFPAPQPKPDQVRLEPSPASDKPEPEKSQQVDEKLAERKRKADPEQPQVVREANPVSEPKPERVTKHSPEPPPQETPAADGQSEPWSELANAMTGVPFKTFAKWSKDTGRADLSYADDYSDVSNNDALTLLSDPTGLGKCRKLFVK